MQCYSTSVPGVGNSKKDEKAKPRKLTSVHMSGRWAHHAYRMSHDRQANVFYRPEGIEVMFKGARKVIPMDIRGHPNREFIWHPDSRRVAFWAPLDEARHKRVALMDIRKVSEERPYTILYDPKEAWHEEGVEHIPYGMEWSPGGNALYVLEWLNYVEDSIRPRDCVLIKVDLSKKNKATEILRKPGHIDFFMPPVSRFENGGGISKAGYWIAFGHKEGLYLLDPVAAERGEGGLRRIVTLPAVGLKNIEWNPRRDQLLVYFDRPSQAADGSQLLGVYLVHLDKVKPDEIPQTDVEDGGEAKPKQEWLERLFNEGGIHTLWFSPQGRFVTWSSSEAVFFRRPDALGEEPTVVEIQLETGEYLDIKGVTWHDSERYLGITAGPRAFVYDVQAKELTEVVNLEDSMPEGGFLAEPVWVKDELFFTKFEDVTAATEEKLLKPVLIQKK
ncbi:MAG: hypothetical protein KDD82_07845 [Planctomycetes bacterium]|nr:hypothetical protein [Planctomycetota bacterium]